MAKIYLVRHCESEGNATRRTQAQTDALVTVKGYEQNEVLRRRFHGVHLDAIYASDTFRSIATADPIAKERGLPIRVRISLREVTTGVWEDMAWGNIAQEYPEANQVWSDAPWDNITPAPVPSARSRKTPRTVCGALPERWVATAQPWSSLTPAPLRPPSA